MSREAVSVFEIFKIGVGPSSSHTMGPWRAALRFLSSLPSGKVDAVKVDLFGSLAKTGKGHGTDYAVLLGLSGLDYAHSALDEMRATHAAILATKTIRLGNHGEIGFDPEEQIEFRTRETLPGHPNAMTLTAFGEFGTFERTYYSVGGGAILEEGAPIDAQFRVQLPFPVETGEDLLAHCTNQGATIPEIVRLNERAWRTDGEIDAGLDRLWEVMLECIHRGCLTDGVLPGGLNVTRRAAGIARTLLPGNWPEPLSWLAEIDLQPRDFDRVTKWVSTFALAVNEQNAAFERVVTAPTNGAAGVIPAVLGYAICFQEARREQVRDFLLVAGEIGSLFKKGATISAAMGGCQAEIGVSSAMAAAGLAQVMGANPARVLMAAEIAMEHHLGLTCDPIRGLVQVPCIERNTMGAMKAITAANIALESDPALARVSLDEVIATMWQTALDMKPKYKETSEGGLATQVSVIVPEC